MKKLFVILAMLTALNASAQWVQTNGPSGGPVNNIFVKGDTIYATTHTSDYASYGGVYYSLDNGLNWKNITPHIPFWEITSIVKNNEMLYVGTNWPWGSHGVYMSSNNGANWVSANTIPNTSYVMNMTVCNGVVIIGTDCGIFKTSDNGLNWQTINGISYCCKFVVQGTNLYAIESSLGNACGPLSGLWGLFLSTNYGNNWQCISFCDSAVNAITFKDNFIIVSANNRIYKSSNNGGNWTRINDTVLTGGVTNFVVSGNNLYAFSFYNIYLTTNNGNNWNKIVSNIYGAPIQSMAVKDNYLFAGTAKMGVYRSSNAGNNWSVVNNGLAATIVNALCEKGNRIFAGTIYNGGIFSSTNNGDTWESVHNGIDGNYYFLSLAAKGDYLYGGGKYQLGGSTKYDVMTTTNNGTNWYLSTDIQRDIYALTTAGNNVFAGVMYYSYQYVYRSTNNGVNWTPSTNGINSQYNIHSFYTINDTTVLAAAGDLWKTTNSGMNWVLSDSGNISNHIFALGSNDTLIYAGASTGDLYVSTNRGNNWVHKTTEIMGKNINCITAYKNFVIAGMLYPGGLYMSTNYGENWVYSGLDSLIINSLLIHDGYVFAATVGYGVWKYPLSPIVKINTIEQNVPKYYGLSQNYPNPFNPITNVKFSIVNGGQVKLIVYDIQGREVQTLVNERLQPRMYEVSFDGSMLNSGVYFYKLITDGYTVTKKMLLIK